MEKFKQKLKKTTAMLMIAVLLMGVAPIGSLADVDWSEFAITASAVELVDGDYEYTVKNGEATITDYYGDGGYVVIPSELGGYPVTYIGDWSFDWNQDISGIQIPNGVKGIGYSAFASCYSLNSIFLPDSVTSINSGAFSGTAYYDDENNWENGALYIGKYLIGTDEDISENYEVKTGTICIADSAFASNRKVRAVTFPEGVVNIGNSAFEYAEYLKTVILSNTVENIGWNAFSGTWIDSIVLPDGVKSIGGSAFAHCGNLKSVYLGKSVSDIESLAFLYCSKLSSITADVANEYFSADEAGVLFSKDKTTLVQYPTGNDRTEYSIPVGVKDIGDYAFAYCKNIENVTIPDGVKTVHTEAFYECDGIKEIIIPDSVNVIESSAFSDCDALESVKLSNGLMSIGSFAFYSCNSLKSIEIPYGVKIIGEYAFQHCSDLTNISVPDSIVSIGAFAFSLTGYYNDENNWENGALYINNFLYKVRDEFAGKLEVKEGTKIISNDVFWSCESVTSFTVPESVKCIGIEALNGEFNGDISDIYYGGSKEQWKEIIVVYFDDNNREWIEISIGEYSGHLTNATIHFAKESHIHTHTYTAKTTKSPTCTATGVTTYTCSCGDNYTKSIPAKGHNSNTALKAVSATYTTEGKTAGKKCSVCNTVTVAQQTVAKLTLGKVSGLKAKTVKVAKSSEVTLSWNKIGDGVKYEVYQQNGKKWKKIKTTTKTSYTVKKLKSNKSYKFRVRAVVDDIKGKYSSTLTVKTVPATISKLTLKAGKKQLTASWKSVSSISGYEVQYSTSKKFTKKTTKTVNVKKSAKKTTIKKLKKGKKYYVRVRTYKIVNGKKIYSSWSTVKSVKVK